MVDRDYMPALPTEMVINMYNEPTEDVDELIRNSRNMSQLLDTHVTIYMKDENEDARKTKEGTKATDVEILPNIGRKGETYLNHVLTRWDTLEAGTALL
ncbi:hypothetical protein NX059_003391 [Plenodomus lindquistii]|nr:hypothetical protein NX059_003391 [Plenodomus lindquistii]